LIIREVAKPTAHRGVALTRLVRHAAAAAVALAAMVPLSHAGASPFAGQYRYLYSGDVAVTGADGAPWVLSVFATARTSAQSRNEQRLYIDLLRCPTADTCERRGRWSRELQDSEVHVPEDYGTGTLRTTLDGQSLVMDLKAVAVTNINSNTIGLPATSFSGFGINPDERSISPEVVQYHGANGAVRLGRLSCKVTTDHAELGEITGADTFGEDARYADRAPTALPIGFLKGSRAARC
jgi:hypothetical protein